MTKAANTYLRQVLPPSISGPATDVVLSVLGDSIQKEWTMAEDIEAQLFDATAIGKYLERKASQLGIDYPTNLSMTDELFRQLLIERNIGQLSSERILAILKVYFGKDAVQAHITTSSPETYSIIDGGTLIIKVDGGEEKTIILRDLDFAIPSEATALEVVVALNRSFSQQDIAATALVTEDQTTGYKYVTIYSNKLGMGSKITITGGTLLGVLNFVSLVTSSSSDGWVITTNGAETTYQNSEASSWAELLKVGDVAVILGGEISDENLGSFEIKSIRRSSSGVQSFTVANAGVAETASSEILFYRRTEATIFGNNSAYVTELPPNITRISIPSTSIVTNRVPGEAAYLQQKTPLAVGVAILEADRSAITITTVENHGLSQNDGIFLEGFLYPIGESSGGAVNGQRTVLSVLGPKQFTATVGPGGTSSAPISMTVISAYVIPAQPLAHTGPNAIIYSPGEGLRITSNHTTTTTAIYKNTQEQILGVADSSVFTDEPGYLVIGYGYEYQTVVPYLGIVSSTELLLSPSFKPTVDIPVGADVNWLNGKEISDPSETVAEGACYLTGSEGGRVAAVDAIESIIAAGVELQTSITYPGDVGLVDIEEIYAGEA
jgi:hypothetical protein